MAIQRWDPLRDLVRLQEDVNRMFDDVLGRSTVAGTGRRVAAADWRPPLDLFEEVGHFVLHADLPGVSLADVEIRIERDNLVLEGERRRDREAGLRRERPFGRFFAELALPPTVDRGRIQAHHANGVLEIVLPKKKMDDATSRVEIAGR